MEGVGMVDLLEKHVLPRRFWELPETFPKLGNAHVCQWTAWACRLVALTVGRAFQPDC